MLGDEGVGGLDLREVRHCGGLKDVRSFDCLDGNIVLRDL